VRDYSLSYAAAAGGIVATPHDLAGWVNDLYRGDILDHTQRLELESIVSTKTGKPIAHVTAQDPVGFGLGVEAIYAGKLGTIWAYEGETLGYRTLYFYFPTDGLTVAVAVNSAVSPNLDTTANLAVAIYEVARGNRSLAPAESEALSKTLGEGMKMGGTAAP